jgi:predicted RNase H-like nuclease (RuvC/YqgF family)
VKKGDAAVVENENIEYLKNRVMELEEKVEQLRFSRRVLMNLIEKIEKDKAVFLKNLERANLKVQRNNFRFAQRLWNKNIQLVELELRNKNDFKKSN